MTMVSKKLRKESFESMMRRFKKSCERSDIVNEVRAREHFVKPSYTKYILHEKENCDIVIPNNTTNTNAYKIIEAYILKLIS